MENVSKMDGLGVRYTARCLMIIPAVNIAQGGGVNFQELEPVGEVSCCDTWTVERTCQSLSISLFVDRSGYIYIYIDILLYLWIYMSTPLSIDLPSYRSIYRSIYLGI